MKRLALALALALLPSLAFGQCSGIFPTDTVCGNISGGNASPKAVPFSALPGSTSLIGDVTSTGVGVLTTTLVNGQPGTHTWAAIQTFTLAPVFTDASGTRAALSLGTAALQNTGTSGATLPFLNGTNTWAATQAFAAITATSLNGNTFTTGTYTLTGAAAKVLTFNNSLTFAGTDSTTMTFPSVSATISRTIASGAKTLNTTAISSASCSAEQTDTATGTLTTDAPSYSFNGDPTAITGYVPLITGMLTIIPYPKADAIGFRVCNNTGSSITPGAVTINWRVVR